MCDVISLSRSLKPQSLMSLENVESTRTLRDYTWNLIIMINVLMPMASDDDGRMWRTHIAQQRTRYLVDYYNAGCVETLCIYIRIYLQTVVWHGRLRPRPCWCQSALVYLWCKGCMKKKLTASKSVVLGLVLVEFALKNRPNHFVRTVRLWSTRRYASC